MENNDSRKTTNWKLIYAGVLAFLFLEMLFFAWLSGVFV